MSFLSSSYLGSHVSEASGMPFYRCKKKTLFSSVFSWVFRLRGHGRRVREMWNPILILRRFQRQPAAGVTQLLPADLVPFLFPVSFGWRLLTLPDRMCRENRSCCLVSTVHETPVAGKKASWVVKRAVSWFCFGSGQHWVMSGWTNDKPVMLGCTDFGIKDLVRRVPLALGSHPGSAACGVCGQSAHDFSLCFSIPPARRRQRRVLSRQAPVVPPSSRERTRPSRTSTWWTTLA